MNMTNRVLLGNWEPPTARHGDDEPAEPAPAGDTADRRYRHHEGHECAGVTYQRCGGGVRIVRKRLGAS